MASLPELDWKPTQAKGDRHGHPVDLVVVHRWGLNYVSPAETVAAYHGVISEFLNPANDASAHIVFPGSAVKGKATQMVAWKDYAWTQAAYNPRCDEVESADAIWQGHDPEGFKVLARIVAFRLHKRGLPPVWSSGRGFCRHYDLGAAGGGHTDPTTDLHLWRSFVKLVQAEHARGHFRETWGR